ncbi:MAG: hypothetical protein H6541_07415 [Lentimicrobiaceae bacterium]|nr:hypothetical protein [Lentimicrobiaceae bacterium]HPG33164.1 hypothetical protein [Lentimicrobium sp.]
MKQGLTIVLIMLALATFGQKKQLVEYRDHIVTKAIAELDSALVTPKCDLYRQIAESGIQGEYVFDITLREKGVIATVFVVNDGVNGIPQQNRLKDIVKRYRFSFKVPKGKSYKFQYTFNL